MCALSRVQLWDPMDCSPPGSSVYVNFQARILEQVAISFSRGSSLSRDRSGGAGGEVCFTAEPPGQPVYK